MKGSPRIAAIVLFLLGLAVFLPGIGSKSLWLDEATSVQYARSGPAWVIASVREFNPNMLLYYELLALWVRVFGDSEAAVRSLSALFAALAVAMLSLLGTRLFGRRTGILAALLFTANAFVLQYAQMARAYGLLLFLVVLSTWFLVSELERPSSRIRLAYVATSSAAFYAHFFAGFVLIAHAVTLVFIRGRELLRGKWVLVALGTALLCTPGVWLVLSFGPAAGAWIPPPTLPTVAQVLYVFAGKSWIVLVVLVGFGLVGSVRGSGTSERWKYLLLWSWFLLPNLLSFTISFWHSLYVPRYLILCVPALMLLGASGLAQIRSRALFLSSAGLLVLVAGTGLLREYRRDAHEDWRTAARYVLESSRPGDGVVFLPDFSRKPFGYYVQRSGRPGPENITGSNSWDRDRIWLVTRESDRAGNRAKFQRVIDSIAAHRRISQQQAFRGVGTTLYVRDQ